MPGNIFGVCVQYFCAQPGCFVSARRRCHRRFPSWRSRLNKTGRVLTACLVVSGSWGLQTVEGAGRNDLSFLMRPNSIAFKKPDWLHQYSKTPLLVAAVVFSLQTIGVVVVLSLLTLLHDSLERWSVEIKQCLWSLLLICSSGVLYYSFEYSAEVHLVVCADNIGGEHLLMRNIYWLGSTVLQWYIHKLIFLDPSTSLRVVPVYIFCVLMQFTGILMVVTPYQNFFFVASSVCFILMFQQAYRLPQLQETAVVGRQVLHFQLFLWICYPTVHLLKVMGWLTVWQQQVLVHSALDFCAKGLTLGSVLAARLARTLSSISGAMQTMTSTHDLVFMVGDSFDLLWATQDTGRLYQYFTRQDGAPSNLLELCADEEDVDRLRRAARIADGLEPAACSPKCMVSLALQQGVGTVGVACYVSRRTQGRRMVGVTLESPGKVAAASALPPGLRPPGPPARSSDGEAPGLIRGRGPSGGEVPPGAPATGAEALARAPRGACAEHLVPPPSIFYALACVRADELA